MNLKNILPVCGIAAAAFVFCGTLSAGQRPYGDGARMEQRLQKLAAEGNWNDLRKAAQAELDAMDPDDEWAGAVWFRFCLGLICGNEIAQYDAMFEKYAAGKFAQNMAFFSGFPHRNMIPGYGIILGSEFKRGPCRGNAGREVSCYERDRARLLALMAPLIPQAEKAAQSEIHGNVRSVPSLTVRSRFFHNMADVLLQNRGSGSSYKLQVLTDLEKLPDYNTDEGCVTSVSRPPVNAGGTPVFYKMPESWDKAANDGERLRFAVERCGPGAAALWAEFLCGQFDFLAAQRQFRREYYVTPAMKQYLYDLKDNETVADLADGIRKITLPDGFNYIEMFKKLEKHYRVGEIYASRMQFEKAAEAFEKDSSAAGRFYAAQIRGSWGAPDQMFVAPAGTEFTVPYHFRNAKKVTVKLYRADTAKSIELWLEHLKDPEKRMVSPTSLPYCDKASREKLIGKEPEKVLTFDLHPLPHHWETTEYLKFGKLAPGAFVAEFVPDGNPDSRVTSMIWAADCALTALEYANNGRIRLFLNDPATGKPVPGVTLKIHSFYYSYSQVPGAGRGRITPEVLTFRTDENGIADFSGDAFKPPEKSRLSARCVIAETSPGKLTMLQGCCFYTDSRNMAPYEVWRTFMITDKTVYRPGDAIAFTGYLRQPSYSGKFNTCHNRTVTLKFFDPRHKEAFKKEVPFDERTQSFTFEMKLPADAMLGQWRVQAEDIPVSTIFTVEEYRKPEYLLTVTPPVKPVKAGEKIPVTIEAKYYFGAPMSGAEISYRVFRAETARLFPFVFVWDWLYGDRYALCTALSGNEKIRNINSGRVMILNTKGKTDAQGKLTFEIDSADAVAKFGGKDFRYTIEAEVKDSTNRVVSGSGSVIAAVRPFSVSVYTPWGFAKTGARHQIEVAARTPNGEKVKGAGTLRIFRRALNGDGVPARTGAPLKTISFLPDGPDKPEFTLNEEGVYELDAEVVSEDGIAVSKSVPFFVAGGKQGGSLFGEYPMSVSTDKPTYQPGETAQILVVCGKPGRTVYFITRSEREAKIRCVTLDGYSGLFDIPVEKGDQPNFFVDVLSYQDGKMLTLRKQIAVPPEKKILNVSAKPAADKVKPGSVLPLKITVTGLDGKPVSGNATVAVYDKSLEAVHGSPIPAIRPFFWSWTRWNNLRFISNFRTALAA